MLLFFSLIFCCCEEARFCREMVTNKIAEGIPYLPSIKSNFLHMAISLLCGNMLVRALHLKLSLFILL